MLRAGSPCRVGDDLLATGEVSGESTRRTLRLSYDGAMPGKKMHSIKRPAQYEALKDKGYSKERAAKISNASRKAKK